MVIIDTSRETIAVAEARRLKIPTVAIVDTNADPDQVSYPIAGNDDANQSDPGHSAKASRCHLHRFPRRK